MFESSTSESMLDGDNTNEGGEAVGPDLSLSRYKSNLAVLIGSLPFLSLL
ncbi:hypothetical protein [Ekhidna sp.]